MVTFDQFTEQFVSVKQDTSNPFVFLLLREVLIDALVRELTKSLTAVGVATPEYRLTSLVGYDQEPVRSFKSPTQRGSVVAR